MEDIEYIFCFDIYIFNGRYLIYSKCDRLANWQFLHNALLILAIQPSVNLQNQHILRWSVHVYEQCQTEM